ncbi:hypothetical protein BDV26DRAFT_302415 [Aspergillus bertholletiae]|uniref:NAD(P)-binding domain-containing protein n=1 Tax=Aspergillus bertholletiae TaxID=1226010 RepID=A0A5N7BGP1_9EURO|nr:hypothetical protein BDV26DRAFT_302415 [Aspergillus bertholletiae]
MAPSLFLTGATGYIGGDFLFAVYDAHPDWQYTALVRREEQAAQLKARYPTVRTVLGDLDSSAILEEEAKNADIVLHFADCDHEPSARALTKGLGMRKSDRPAFFIHTSGMGILTVEDLTAKTCGTRREKQYDDWDGVSELVTMPDSAFHRNVDKIVLEAAERFSDSMKTAIVCPSAIYGLGRGTGNTESTQVYVLAKTVITRGKGLQVGEGQNIWHSIHVHDLTNLYIALVEAAAEGGGSATWGTEGYYLVENGSFVWGDVERAVAQIAYEKGFIQHAGVDVLGWDATAQEHSKGPYRWGSNSRGRALRARKLLGWNPTQLDLVEFLPSIVELQAEKVLPGSVGPFKI